MKMLQCCFAVNFLVDRETSPGVPMSEFHFWVNNYYMLDKNGICIAGPLYQMQFIASLLNLNTACPPKNISLQVDFAVLFLRHKYLKDFIYIPLALQHYGFFQSLLVMNALFTLESKLDHKAKSLHLHLCQAAKGSVSFLLGREGSLQMAFQTE